eukprot:GHUV01012853.1.p2 GENE.GHUV01012853.1~~GHUV01012853.1.p2  ORF type:complete len:166 (+),score=51.59 GHUV01012853.1:1406-1903(+)
MFKYCQTQLSLGLSIVVDCPFARVELFDEAHRVAHKFGATVAVVDVTISDQQLWQQRLEDRVQQEAGTSKCHKPQTWQQIQQLMVRYNGCWQWSTNGSRQLEHYSLVDSARHSLDDSVQAVLDFLQRITDQQPGAAKEPDAVAASDSRKDAVLDWGTEPVHNCYG